MTYRAEEQDRACKAEEMSLDAIGVWLNHASACTHSRLAMRASIHGETKHVLCYQVITCAAVHKHVR